MEFKNPIALFRIGTYSRPIFIRVHSFEQIDQNSDSYTTWGNTYPVQMYSTYPSYQFRIEGELLDPVPEHDKSRLESKETLFLLKTKEVWPSRFIMEDHEHNVVVSDLKHEIFGDLQTVHIEFTLAF